MPFSLILTAARLKNLSQISWKLSQKCNLIISAIKFSVADVYFTVRLGSDTSVPGGESVKFDTVISNVGAGYIDDSGHTDYGKFVVPISGTYQFLVTITNSNQATNSNAKIDLVVNDAWKVNIHVSGQEDVGTCHLVIKLKEGDKIWVMSVTYNPNYFEGSYTSFSGHLIHTE